MGLHARNHEDNRGNSRLRSRSWNPTRGGGRVMLSVLVQVDNGDCSGSRGHRDSLGSGSLGRSSGLDMELPLLRGYGCPRLSYRRLRSLFHPLGRILDFLGLAQKTSVGLHGCIMKNPMSEHNSKKKKKKREKRKEK